MRSATSARVALGFLFVVAVVIGLTATVAPTAFYDDFPFVTHWVQLLPPYNEHLVCVAWLLTATIHLLFHAGHLEGFGSADAIAEIAGLALLLAPPPIAIWGSGEGGIRTHETG